MKENTNSEFIGREITFDDLNMVLCEDLHEWLSNTNDKKFFITEVDSDNYTVWFNDCPHDLTVDDCEFA